MEIPGGGKKDGEHLEIEENCLIRRTVAAHADYIHTQKPNKGIVFVGRERHGLLFICTFAASYVGHAQKPKGIVFTGRGRHGLLLFLIPHFCS